MRHQLSKTNNGYSRFVYLPCSKPIMQYLNSHSFWKEDKVNDQITYQLSNKTDKIQCENERKKSLQLQ